MISQRVPVSRPTTDARGGFDWLPGALFLLAAGLALNSLLGPLAADLVDYQLSETLRNQTIGLDAISLLIVAPMAVVAALLTQRRTLLGPVLAVVAGSYTAYMFLQFVVGPDYPHYPGTLPLMMGLFILGWVVAARGWTAAAAHDTPSMAPATRTRHSLVLFGLGGFVVLRYLPGLLAAFGGDGIPEESLADPAMFWTIFLLDLGIFVPLTLATAVALRRGAGWAALALAVAVGWFVLVTLAVLAMSIVMVVNTDPHGAVAQVVLFAVTAAAVTTYAARLLLPLAVRTASGANEKSSPIEAGSRS